MRIGELRHRVTLESPTRTADGMGGFTTAWTTVAEVFAAVWPVSATEQIEALQTVMTVTHRIRMRYRSDVASSWRVKFGDRYFAIVSLINPNEAGKLLDLLCKEAT